MGPRTARAGAFELLSPSVVLAEKVFPFFEDGVPLVEIPLVEVIVARLEFPFPFHASRSVSPRLASAGPVSLLSPKGADGGYSGFMAPTSPAESVRPLKSEVGGVPVTKAGGATSGVTVSMVGLMA